MFTRSASFYDAIYGFKDYEQECEHIYNLIQMYKQSEGNSLLDVACGTGRHIAYLSAHYQSQGLDLNEELLAVARKRSPNTLFHQGDMVDFRLDEAFDVITCLFSAIGYVKTEDRLQRAIRNMAAHLVPGGVLIVEPWISPDVWVQGRLHAQQIDEPDLKITRMSISERAGDLAVIEFHYLVGTPEGIYHFTEQHELGLFPTTTYRAAFELAGLDTYHDPEGLIGRGLFIGVKPVSV